MQTFQLNSLNRELGSLREKAAVSEQHRDRLNALEQQVAENRGDTAALKSSVASRTEELAALERKVPTTSAYRINNYDPKTGKQLNVMANDPNAGAWTAWENRRVPVAAAADPAAGGPPMPVTMGQTPTTLEQRIQKVYPTAPPPTKDMTVRVLPDGVIQYQTADGRVVQQFKDTRIATPGRTAANPVVTNPRPRGQTSSNPPSAANSASVPPTGTVQYYEKFVTPGAPAAATPLPTVTEAAP